MLLTISQTIPAIDSPTFDKFKSILGGGSSITGSMDKLLSSSKSKTLAQLDAMKSSFEKTWNEMAEATGVSKDDITATSKEMYDKMTKLVNDTYAAIGDNTALSSEQVEQLTQTLFKSMQSTYTSGWNRIASLTDEMTEEQANKMAIAYGPGWKDDSACAQGWSRCCTYCPDLCME